MACTFVTGLPNHVRLHHQAMVRMNDMILGQFLTRARAIMPDMKGGPVIVAA